MILANIAFRIFVGMVFAGALSVLVVHHFQLTGFEAIAFCLVAASFAALLTFAGVPLAEGKGTE